MAACRPHPLIRNTFRYASKRYWGQIAADLNPSTGHLLGRPRGRGMRSSRRSGASRIRRSAGSGATPGNSSLRSWTTTPRSAPCCARRTRSSRSTPRYRRAVTVRGHFPTEQAALKCLYLVTPSLDPKGTRSDTMGHALEAGPQRVRDHLRRLHAQGRGQVAPWKLPLTPLLGQTYLAPIELCLRFRVEVAASHSGWLFCQTRLV